MSEENCIIMKKLYLFEKKYVRIGYRVNAKSE